MITHALAYASYGWSVIPLQFTGDVDARKRPLLYSWDPYKTTPATPDEIRAWWTKWPQANIGVVTGAVSGLVALDLDGPNALGLLTEKGIYPPKTAAVQTGKGYHALYKHPGYEITNKVKLLSDGQGSAVDVRGDGGYVVAPPSVHGSGRVYKWIQVPELGLSDLGPALADLLTERTPSPALSGDLSWVDAAMAGAPQGARDDTATRLAGYWLHRLKGNIEDTLRILRPWAIRCEPPFSDSDLRKCVQSVARRDAVSRQAEDSKGLPHIAVVEGDAWANELRDAVPRQGTRMAIPGFDLLGPIVPGDLIVLAGRPGMGKSTLACQLCVKAMGLDLSTYIVSTEMSREQWGRWMVAILAEQSFSSLPRPLPEPILMPWRVSDIAISDPGTITIGDIRKLAEGRLGLRLLIVDHLGRIAGGRKESRTLEVGDVARGLKSIAKDLGCAVVALCQLNRRVEGDDNKCPRLSDLRESGEIEQEADAVLFLWTKERDITQAHLPMEMTLAKHRHGPPSHVSVTFDKPARKFIPHA